jgi:hypothetical protein
MEIKYDLNMFFLPLKNEKKAVSSRNFSNFINIKFYIYNSFTLQYYNLLSYLYIYIYIYISIYMCVCVCIYVYICIYVRDKYN